MCIFAKCTFPCTRTTLKKASLKNMHFWSIHWVFQKIFCTLQLLCFQTQEKSVTNNARISSCVSLMTEFQRVINFSDSDHCLRQTTGSCRRCDELLTRPTIKSTTFIIDHVEREYGHHKLVGTLSLRVPPQHLHDRLSSKLRELRWG